MTRWDKYSAESRVYGFDFGRLLEAGETLTGATFAVAVVTGTDPTPAAILVGAATVAGAIARQRIAGGVGGATYRVTATATTSAGNTLSATAFLQVVA